MRSLSPDEVVEVLRKLHELSERQAPALLARLKHMGRLDFPSARGVGRGHRACYALDEVLRIVIAFQLIETGVASAWAVEIVSAEWSMMADALAGASTEAATPMAVLRPRALATLGVPAGGRRQAWGAGGLARRRSALGGGGERGSTAMVVIDLWHMLRKVRSLLIDLPNLSLKEFDAALALVGQTARVFD